MSVPEALTSQLERTFHLSCPKVVCSMLTCEALMYLEGMAEMLNDVVSVHTDLPALMQMSRLRLARQR